MDSIETLIPDHGGNHLVVVLCFYDDTDKVSSFQIPEELTDLDIADISISKLEVKVYQNRVKRLNFNKSGKNVGIIAEKHYLCFHQRINLKI